MFFFFLGSRQTNIISRTYISTKPTSGSVSESLTPGVNSGTSISTRPTTGSVAESSGASESLTPGVNSGTSISTRPTTGSVAESSGASLSSGFQTLFALFFGLFSSSPILSTLK